MKAKTNNVRVMTVPEMNVINAAKALMRSLTPRQRENLTGKRRTLMLAVQRLERLDRRGRVESAVRCGHSACSQHYIDTGSRECVE